MSRDIFRSELGCTEVDIRHVKASFRGGLLAVVLPKKPPVERNAISIK